MTNREFAKKDETFRKICKTANVRATGRQASKYLRGKGIAWEVLTQKVEPLTPSMSGYFNLGGA